MVAESAQPLDRYPSFKAWKVLLREDCRRRDKLPAFNALGETILEFLWQQGLDPSVQAIVDSRRNWKQSC